MVAIHELWLPILLSSVAVYIISSFLHMMTSWHKGDYTKLPDEQKVMDALRLFSIPPGEYMAPLATGMKEMRTPEFAERYRKGPVFMLTTWAPGPMSMGKNLVLWFLYTIVVGIFAAYIAGRALGPGAGYLQVFRFAGATAFIGYSLALWQAVIWFRRSWITTMKATVDGLIYALVSAGFFGWLWPR